MKVEKQGGLRRKETVREPVRPAPVWSSVSSFWSSISMSSNTALFVINLFNNNLVTVSCCLFCRGFCLFSRACDRLLLLCRLRGFRRLHYLTVSVWLAFNLFLFYKDILCFVAQNIMKIYFKNFHFLYKLQTLAICLFHILKLDHIIPCLV